MAELNTVARPYAQAAFEVALAADAFDEWENALDVLAVVVADKRVAGLINNPKVSIQSREGFLFEFCDQQISEGFKNLVKLMSQNRRLSLLPSVADLFKELRAQVEQTKVAEVVTASELSDELKDSFIAALQKRFDCQVSLSCRVDENVIGGGVVRVGDWVVDGSVATQLKRLETVLAN